jgi:hypothetical protein
MRDFSDLSPSLDELTRTQPSLKIILPTRNSKSEKSKNKRDRVNVTIGEDVGSPASCLDAECAHHLASTGLCH